MDSENNYQAAGRYETEAQRLQREADDYTKALEYERKRFLILEDQYKQKQAIYNMNAAKIKEMIPSKEEEHLKEVNRLHSHALLENEQVRLNDTIGDNAKLKVQIDVMRKEIVFALETIKKMNEQVEQLKHDINVCATESITNGRIAGETNNQILALKAKHEEEKEKFEVEIKKL